MYKLTEWVRNDEAHDFTNLVIEADNDDLINDKVETVIGAWLDMWCESVEVKTGGTEKLEVEIVHPFASSIRELFVDFLKTLSMD